jgi:eukaryotic-like serine/threonine-protein kinase
MNAALALSLLVAAAASGPTASDLKGAWLGTLTHEGETAPVALELEPLDDGRMQIFLTIPAVHTDHTLLGPARLEVTGNDVRLGPFSFVYDGEARTLSGTTPAELVPVYRIPITLRHVDRLQPAARPEPKAPLAEPVWTFDAGSPLWAGATVADGVVFAGGEDGRLHAIDAATGKERWSFRTGGPIRTRATVTGGEAFVAADDGFLYKVKAASGDERWRVKVALKPIERLPFDNPKSRYDRFGSDVTVVGGVLYLGTHDGKVLALDAARGTRIWEFAAGDAVLAAPAVDHGRAYFGSYDHHVYALDAATGKLLWRRDTGAPVVSSPAVAGNRVVIGTRGYDLLGLDATTGDLAWKRYVWFSWVDSSATIRDGIAYVGSSDAAAAFAFDVQTGRRVWMADVYGWAWGQPAVSEGRVYVGAASQVGYMVGHRGAVFALDRATGDPIWRHDAKPSASGSYGFPGSPAVGAGLVFVTGLDGRVYAFPE